MTITWGKRSTGEGAVKRGYRPWTLMLHWPWRGQPSVMYVNPITGGGASVSGWNIIRARSRALELARRIEREEDERGA